MRNIVNCCIGRDKGTPSYCNPFISHILNALVTVDDLKLWLRYTRKESKFYGFDGNHFFINEYCAAITKLIGDVLLLTTIDNRHRADLRHEFIFSHLQIQHVKNQIEYTAIQSRRSLFYTIWICFHIKL